MSEQPDPSSITGGQWARGDQNVQVKDVGQGASVQVTFAGQARRVPLRAAAVPLGRTVRSPARLMRASSGVLPFVDRDGLLDDLQAWMADPRSFSTYLIGGRGGSGKTRLGVQMCLLAEQRGWVCGLLEDAAEQAGVEALAGVPAARLVVVDYAETRAERLAALLPALIYGASVEHPVRVLLLVRASPHDGDWCAALRGHGDRLNAVLEDTEVQVLDDHPLTTEERAELFTATADAFARHEQPKLTSGAAPPPPLVLQKPVFTTALMVVVAAYLAVHDAPNPPTTRQGLLTELAEHEDRYWLSSMTKFDLHLDKIMRARVVATATLAGADTEAEARDLLALLPDLSDASAADRGRLARWVYDLYPGPRWWNPLEPDLLGEHLVATHLVEVPDVLAGALQRSKPAALIQPLSLYARAAADYSALGAAIIPVLTAALPGLCRTAVAQAAAYADLTSLVGTATIATALQRAVSTIALDAVVLPEALNTLPARPDLILGPLALALTHQLATSYQDLAATEPAAYEAPLATTLNNLSNRLSDLGRHPEALSAIEQSLTIRRRLAATDPSAHEPDLAMALYNLSNCLSQAGRHAEALSAIEQSVSIRRRLATANPVAYEPELASSLNSLSNHVSSLGRHTEALSVSEQAESIYQRLAMANPTAYEPELAMALSNLSAHLSDLGRHTEAQKAVDRAVTIYQRLATANPAAYEPDLAMALSNLSNYLSQNGQHAEALSVIEQSVSIRRHLATMEPATYEPHLAGSLNNLSNYLSDLGRHPEALSAIEQAVTTYQRLATANPAAYEPHLAMVMHNLSNRLSQTGRHPEAQKVMEQTLTIYQRLAKANPATYEPRLATALHNFSAHLSRAGQSAETLEAIEQAVTIRRRLAATEPAAHEPDLAASLNNLSNYLSDFGRHPEALSAIEQAVTIRRRLVAVNLGAYGPDLAASLSNLSNRLRQAGRHAEAQETIKEADELRSRD